MNTRILFAFVCWSYGVFGADPHLMGLNPYVGISPLEDSSFQLRWMSVDLLVDGQLNSLRTRVTQYVPTGSRRVAQLGSTFLSLGALSSLTGGGLVLPALLTLIGEPIFSRYQSQPLIRRQSRWDRRGIRVNSIGFGKLGSTVRNILRGLPQIVSEHELAYPKRLIVNTDIAGVVRQVDASVEIISGKRAGSDAVFGIKELRQAPGCMKQFFDIAGEAL